MESLSRLVSDIKRIARLPKRGFVSVSGLAVLAWLIVAGGWAPGLNNAAFDYLSDVPPATGLPPPSVVLVRSELRAHHFGDDYWLTLLGHFRSGGARRIAFTNMPEGASERFYDAAAADSDVVFGRTLVLPENDLGYTGTAAPPQAAAGFALQFGIVEPPSAIKGVMRSIPNWIEFQGKRLPSFAQVAAFGPRLDVKQPPPSFLLDFSRGPNGLLTISADRILAGQLNLELLRDKVVLVGYVDDTYIPLVSTPFAGGVASISLLTLQGIAVDNLLQQRGIAPLMDEATFPILLLLAIVLFPMFIRLRFGFGVLVTAGLLIALYYIGRVGLTSFQIWLPIGQIALLLVCEFVYTAVINVMRKDSAFALVSEGVTQRLAGLNIPVSFNESADHWRHIANFIDARMEVSRLIILELTGKNRRLKEVVALHCTFEDIDERRRDPSRVPYSIAAESTKPSRLSGPFFKSDQSADEEFLLPLRFGGELLGFWAFAIAREKMVQIPMFSMLVVDYAKEIGKLLYNRHHWQATQRQTWFERWFQFDPKRLPHNQLRHAVAMLGSRLKTLEDTLESMTTAIGVFDLFGRYVAGSYRLRSTLADAGIEWDDCNLFTIMTQFANVPEDEVKRSLRYVVHQHGVVSVVTNVKGEDGATLTLHVRPLQRDVDEQLGESEAAPFELRGIIVELVDVTRLRRIYELKEGLVEKINQQLRGSLQGVQHAANVMGNKTVPEVHRSRLLTLTGKRLSDAVDVLEEAQRYLQLNLHGARLECFPVEIKPILQRALHLVDLTAQQRGIGIRVDLEGMEHEFGFADPQTLEDMLMLILSYLVSSAEPDTTVDVYLKQDPLSVIKRHEIVLWFSNSSRRETRSSIKKRLMEDSSSGEDEYFHIRNAMRMAQTWGGSLAVDVEADRHIVIKLTLKGFL